VHVAIVGNGVAGVSAALRLRRRRPDARITLVSGESRHHYSRPALMYVFMGHMRYADTKPFPDGFWAEQRIDLVRDWVSGIDFRDRRLATRSGAPIHFDRLLLATGSKPNRFGWPGQDLQGVQGLYGLYDLKKLEETLPRTRRAVIVGGGLIGIELAEMLLTRGIAVTFLVREASYWDNVLPAEESAMVGRLVRRHGIELRTSTQLREVLDDGSGRCRAVVTTAGDELECQLVGLTAGVAPNVDLVRDTELAVGRGILVDSSLRASLPGVLAAGDCAEIVGPAGGPGLIQQVWYTGKRQGEVAGDVLAGDERAYEPGIWFNSAKFFQLEYQVYGDVNRGVPGERSLYWEHASRDLSLRVVHVDGRVIGFNLMGIRWRHEIAERWIAEGRRLDHVLPRLAEAGFDPELFRRWEREIAAAFERQGAAA